MKKTVQLTRMPFPSDDSGVRIDLKSSRMIVAPTSFSPINTSETSNKNPLLVTSIPKWNFEFDFEYSGSIGINRVGTVTQTNGRFHALYEQTLDISKTFIKSIDPSPNFEGNLFSITFDKIVAYKTLAGKTLGQIIENGDTIRGTEAIDTIKLTDKSEIVFAGGEADYLYGRGGNDHLSGEDGADRIYGGTGDDGLDGGDGNDIIRGEIGNDTLFGGSGSDKMLGGGGADIFLFKSYRDSTTASCDIVEDFTQSQGDKIHLDGIDANNKLAGNQAFKFIGSDDFHKQSAELRFEKKGSDTFLYADVNGDGKADISIKFEGAISFVKGDFIL